MIKYKIYFVLLMTTMFILIFSMASVPNIITVILIIFNGWGLTEVELKLNKEHILNKKEDRK